jgi:DNA-binding transcriptional ArsR family regulator
MDAFVELPQAEVSRHLARQRTDGLVRAGRQGRSTFCALAE